MFDGTITIPIQIEKFIRNHVDVIATFKRHALAVITTSDPEFTGIQFADHSSANYTYIPIKAIHSPIKKDEYLVGSFTYIINGKSVGDDQFWNFYHVSKTKLASVL